jgi:hypothetical protein
LLVFKASMRLPYLMLELLASAASTVMFKSSKKRSMAVTCWSVTSRRL